MIHTAYIGFILAGMAVGVVNFVLAWRRAGLPLGWRVMALIAATIVSGLLGARLHALVEQGPSWTLATTVDGGFRLSGGLIGLLIGFAVWRAAFLPAIAFGRVADLGAITASFGLAVIRLGCLAAGCCFGTVSDLPLAIRFPLGTQAATVHAALGLIGPGDTASLPVHPLQIYFMLLHLAVGVFLLWFERRKAYDGQLLLLGLALGEGGKALLEGFRQPIPRVPVLHLRVVSAALASAAGLALVVMAVRTRRQPLSSPRS